MGKAKWVYRIAVALLIVVTIVSVALYVVYFQRVALPSLPAHARVEPVIKAIPGLSLCWVETASRFPRLSIGATAGSLLVKHPAGDLLIDTGNSSRFDSEIQNLPFSIRVKVDLLAGQLKTKAPLPDLLRLVNESPATIRWVILSHSHLDHAGGLIDLPDVQILATQEEITFARDPKVQATGYVISSHAAKLPLTETLHFTSQPYEIFDESVDLYGDGSVVVVPLRGHTPGSVGIFVNLTPDRRVFYVGDAVDDERGFLELSGKPFMLRDTDNDLPRANEIVARLHQLHTDMPNLTIIPAHGRSAYSRFFPNGPLSCVGH
jgi:glyoxylase-like metal-dependent hydrolase (beta-lactamase superfamily II)